MAQIRSWANRRKGSLTGRESRGVRSSLSSSLVGGTKALFPSLSSDSSAARCAGEQTFSLRRGAQRHVMRINRPVGLVSGLVETHPAAMSLRRQSCTVRSQRLMSLARVLTHGQQCGLEWQYEINTDNSRRSVGVILESLIASTGNAANARGLTGEAGARKMFVNTWGLFPGERLSRHGWRRGRTIQRWGRRVYSTPASSVVPGWLGWRKGRREIVSSGWQTSSPSWDNRAMIPQQISTAGSKTRLTPGGDESSRFPLVLGWSLPSPAEDFYV